MGAITFFFEKISQILFEILNLIWKNSRNRLLVRIFDNQSEEYIYFYIYPDLDIFVELVINKGFGGKKMKY